MELEQEVEPSAQTVTNILTMEERVKAILAYDSCKMYSRVQKMFNCSWKQVKDIVAHRENIMGFLEYVRMNAKGSDPLEDAIRERKIMFLDECLTEYILRLEFRTKSDIPRDDIKTKANEFKDIIQIPNFTPDDDWLQHFITNYNIFSFNRKTTFKRHPPPSLNLKRIMIDCSNSMYRGKTNLNPVFDESTTFPLQHWIMEEVVALGEQNQRRQRKLNLLEEALNEYSIRANIVSKVPVSDDMLLETAKELGDLLELENFEPDFHWLFDFKFRYDLTNTSNSRKLSFRQLSLNLKDVLSHCSREIGRGINAQLKHKHNSLPPFNTIKIRKTKENIEEPTNPLASEPDLQQLNPKDNSLPPFKKIKLSKPKENKEEPAKPLMSELELKPQLWLTPIFEPEPTQKLEVPALPEDLDTKPDLVVLEAELDKSTKMILCDCRPEIGTDVQPEPKDNCLPPFKKIMLSKPKENKEDPAKPLWLTPIYEPGPTQKLEVPALAEDLDTKPDFVELESQLDKSSNMSISEDCNDSLMKSSKEADAAMDSKGLETFPAKVRSVDDVMQFMEPIEEYAMFTNNYGALRLLDQLQQIFSEHSN